MTLKEARLNAGYTQAQLAQMVGITVDERNGQFYSPLYCMIEKGQIMMSAACYLKLCELLRVKPGDIEPPCKTIVGNPRNPYGRKGRGGQ